MFFITRGFRRQLETQLFSQENQNILLSKENGSVIYYSKKKKKEEEADSLTVSGFKKETSDLAFLGE